MKEENCALIFNAHLRKQIIFPTYSKQFALQLITEILDNVDYQGSSDPEQFRYTGIKEEMK